jgi:hypothetical protein
LIVVATIAVPASPTPSTSRRVTAATSFVITARRRRSGSCAIRRFCRHFHPNFSPLPPEVLERCRAQLRVARRVACRSSRGRTWSVAARPNSTWPHSRSAISLARRPCGYANGDQPGVPVPVAVAAPGGGHELLDLGRRQVFLLTKLGIGGPDRHCPKNITWRHQAQACRHWRFCPNAARIDGRRVIFRGLVRSDARRGSPAPPQS